MTLNEGKIGEIYELQQLSLPLKVAKRLEALGMIVGTKIEVLNNKNHGTLIIKVRGTRFAISNRFSKNILVKEGEAWHRT
jgi:ferrous iron transport protein A